MSYDVLKLCKDEGDHFEVDPAVIFPATIKRIQEVLAGEIPSEIVTPGWIGRPLREPVVDKFLRQAESFPTEAWAIALMPYIEPVGKETVAERAWREQRAMALDFAESWFKRALALAVGRGIRIHINKNLDYRR